MPPPIPFAGGRSPPIPDSASVYDVNDKCQTLGNLQTWHRWVLDHERLHEKSGNRCLASGDAAAEVLQKLEGANGTLVEVSRQLNDVWGDFHKGPLKSAFDAGIASPVSPYIWDYRLAGSWTYGSLTRRPHPHGDMGLLTDNAPVAEGAQKVIFRDMNALRISRALMLALCAALLAPFATAAQNKPSRIGRANGMVADESGGQRFPTPADAMQVLREEWTGRSAQAVLRQEFESRPQAELDALANELADILLAGNPGLGSDADRLQSAAGSALLASAKRGKWWVGPLERWEAPPPGTPHAGSFDALVRVYETRR